MKKITHLLIFTIMICTKAATAMEIPISKTTHLMVVPGQNGLGGDNVDTVLPHFADKLHLKHPVETPNLIIDFGQGRCQSYLHKQMSSLKKNDKAIIHASSQGTATAGNYTAHYAAKDKKIGALILEAVMLSGNSTIHYNCRGVNTLPGSYYFLPYLAKFVYPFYSPAGDQLVVNAHKLPKNLPIIILHHAQDPQLPYPDAQALYAFLKLRQKNDNVYLMSKDSLWGEHVLLLENTSVENNVQKINTINHILHKHGLLPKHKDLLPKEAKQFFSAESNNYQPEPQQEWLDRFDDLLNKENTIWYIDWGVKTAFYGLIAYIMYKTGIAEKLIKQAQVLIQNHKIN